MKQKCKRKKKHYLCPSTNKVKFINRELNRKSRYTSVYICSKVNKYAVILQIKQMRLLLFLTIYFLLHFMEFLCLFCSFWPHSTTQPNITAHQVHNSMAMALPSVYRTHSMAMSPTVIAHLVDLKRKSCCSLSSPPHGLLTGYCLITTRKRQEGVSLIYTATCEMCTPHCPS